MDFNTNQYFIMYLGFVEFHFEEGISEIFMNIS